MNVLEILFIMTGIHYIADFPLQGDFLGVYKSKYDYLLFVHCFIWTTCLSIGLMYFGIFSWYKVLFLFSWHYLIDRWKCRHKEHKEKGLTKLLWIDQSLHFVQILIVVVM